MNTLRKTLVIFIGISLLFSACGGYTVQAETTEANPMPAFSYRVVLGKSVHEAEVAGFLADNHCMPADAFQLCKEAGMMIWIDAKEIVKTVYLYSGYADGFRRYRGDLPYELTFYDPMWRVQEKLKDLDSANPLHQAGLPDEAGSPDRMHYWAVYKRLGMTVIYNSPGADQDAYIYSILVSQ